MWTKSQELDADGAGLKKPHFVSFLKMYIKNKHLQADRIVVFEKFN